MKSYRSTLIILMVGLGLLLHAGCEEQAMAPRELSPDWFQQSIWQTPKPRAKATSPKITFEKEFHDFGDVGPGTGNLCEFRFANTGDGTLKIQEVGKTCGCTPFLLAKKEYSPGESGTLKVKYYSDTQRGPTTKHLLVRSNDRARPEVALAIKARIVTKVDYEPKTLNLLLKQANAGCPNITLASVDSQPFSITRFTSTGNCVTADFNPSVKATRFVLQPKVDMAKLERTLNGHIEIGLTHPECDAITLALSTLPRFKIIPRSISVRDVEPEQPIVKKVRVLSNYKESFELASVSSRKGIIRVLSNQVVRDGYELELQITPPAAGSRTRLFTEVFSVNTKGGEKLDIPCSGFYAGSSPPPQTTIQDKGECKTCKPKIFYPDRKKIGS